jgi:FlaA1/EpsC-like NDP-sugar epimerase/lipopolysaccharide/colanic/teichoic acid biosynthesis glycosyltransferase
VRRAPGSRVAGFISAHDRQIFFAAGDVVLIVVSLWAAAWLRFDGRIPAETIGQLPVVIAISVAVKLAAFASQRLYAMSWSQVSLLEMIGVFRGVTLGSAVFWLVALALRRSDLLAGFPRSILPLDYIITLYAIGGFRVARRVYQHLTRQGAGEGRRALIVGAGAAGEQLARAMEQTPNSGYAPVGYIDDDERKIGTVIHGLRVLANRERLPEIVKEHQIEAVLIAIPTAPSREVRNIISLARESGVQDIRIIPGIDQLLNGHLALADLRAVQLTDLLGREVARIDTSTIGQWLSGRTVLVTGAGGSIGSELSRQIARFHPGALVLLDSDESQLFWVQQELQRSGVTAAAIVADVRSERRMRDIWNDVTPHVVFHAAAYKHVALMEHHPQEAVATNILGTFAVARASLETGVEKFVLISTDKAVNPVNIMGTSKRLCEKIVTALAGVQQTTGFTSVRFGNVLGSEGSVIPIFKRQIAAGGPVTITHEEARRYFMTISEASKLVIQAGAFGQSGAVFVLDMGEQVKVIDVARQLIRLSGLEPDRDIQIKVIGLREGEKLYEELLTSSERTTMSKHQKIYIWRSERENWTRLGPLVDELCDLARRDGSPEAIRAKLAAVVPDYQPEAARGRARDLQAATARPTRAFADHEEVPAGHRPIAEAPVLAALRTFCRWSAAVPVTVLVGIMALAHVLVAPGSPVFVREPRVGRNRRAGPRRLFEREVPINRRGQDRRRRNFYGRPFSRLQFNAIPRANAGALERRYCLFLRRYRLDRIPSIFNVLNGEMALVGPRPDAPDTVELAATLAGGYGRRFTLRPGVTGLTQILFPDGGGPDEPVRRLEIDKFYVDHRSLGLDLRILTRTFGVVLAGKQEPIRLRDRLQVNTAVATRLNTVGEKP